MRILLFAIAGALGSACSSAPASLDVIWLPTPDPMVTVMLRLARVGSRDVLYDLGCGDGRIVVAAAQRFGTRGVCIEIDPQMANRARERARRAGVAGRVEVRRADLFETDIRPASVVAIYLLGVINRSLLPKFATLRAGSRIVAYRFPIPGVRPARVERLQIDGREHRAFLYNLPLRRELPHETSGRSP